MEFWSGVSGAKNVPGRCLQSCRSFCYPLSCEILLCMADPEAITNKGIACH